MVTYYLLDCPKGNLHEKDDKDKCTKCNYQNEFVSISDTIFNTIELSQLQKDLISWYE